MLLSHIMQKLFILLKKIRKRLYSESWGRKIESSSQWVRKSCLTSSKKKPWNLKNTSINHMPYETCDIWSNSLSHSFAVGSRYN